MTGSHPLGHPNREARIRRTAETRGIRELVHFTRVSNLPSILEHGLVPRAEAGLRGIVPEANDALRLEGHPDATSLSISFPNAPMLAKYRRRAPHDPFAVLVLDPSILWTHHCAFLPGNAAKREFRRFDLSRKADPDVLEQMFTADLPWAARDPALGDEHPTDVQAEVLVFGRIDPSLLRGIVFDRRRHGFRSGAAGVRLYDDERPDGAFGPRADAMAREASAAARPIGR